MKRESTQGEKQPGYPSLRQFRKTGKVAITSLGAGVAAVAFSACQQKTVKTSGVPTVPSSVHLTGSHTENASGGNTESNNSTQRKTDRVSSERDTEPPVLGGVICPPQLPSD